ncbi:putative porin [uncultured Hymenobacter sp.]|uniref:putative porin n=1 Tax=uncultured Hymenobacter sp. TaxID=170016 RepID=UPI0035CB8718
MSDHLLSTFSVCWPLRQFTVFIAWFRRYWAALLSVLLLLASTIPTAQAQILDDSSRVLYGARTTRIIREDDVLRDRTEGRIIDTTLINFPSARSWYHDSTFHQDLGHVGTAARPLLWRTNTQLGTRLGRNVFDRYARDPATIPYYDTKSPYTFFRFIQGGNGEQVFELSYTRSISKNASAGLAYERFAANKLYATNSRSGLVEHTNFLFFARFQSTDERYHALFNYSNVRHRSVEQGGIQPQGERVNGSVTIPADTVPGNLFSYGNEVPRLFQASNTEHRDGLRFVHTYRLIGRGLTAYHIADWRRQMNRFQDVFTVNSPSNTNDIDFFPVALLSRTATDDRAELQQVENTVGVLGRSEAVEYRLYGRHRGTSYITRRRVGDPGISSSAGTENGTDLFLGGTANFRYKIFAIETAGEYALPTGEAALGEYWASGRARLGPLTGEALITSYSPTLTQQQFSGNHYRWGRNFDQRQFDYSDGLELENTNVQQLTARLDQTLGRHRVEASAAIINITDLVYYDEFGEPAQVGTARQLLTGSLRHRFNVGNLFFDNQVHVTRGGQVDEIRIPDLITNSKVYYQGYLFRKALFGQIGAEVYYQSSWQPYDYSPSTQQFFLQNHFNAANFAVADVFVTGDIRTVAVFLKMAYINQGLLRDGYFVTPYYTSLPRRFELGIRWQFFD